MATIRCPACAERFEADEYIEEGDMITCQFCDEELEVVSVTPVKVRQLKEEGGFREEGHGGCSESGACDEEDEDYFNTD